MNSMFSGGFKMTIQEHKLTWNNGVEDIEIVARYEPKAFSGHIAHVDIHSINPAAFPSWYKAL